MSKIEKSLGAFPQKNFSKTALKKCILEHNHVQLEVSRIESGTLRDSSVYKALGMGAPGRGASYTTESLID